MQTAVEWFFNELQRMQYFIGNDMLEAYKQAKEMEKQMIIDILDKREDYLGTQPSIFDYLTNKEWFETYGSKGSDEKKEYPHSHIYETMNGRYGLFSYDEHDQTDGIFDTYQEAVDFGLSLIKPTTSSQTEISDEEIRKQGIKYDNQATYETPIAHFMEGAFWYREQLKTK